MFNQLFLKIGSSVPIAPPAIPVVTPQPLSIAPEMDHKTRIAQLTAQIQARLANRPNFATAPGEDGYWCIIIFAITAFVICLPNSNRDPSEKSKGGKPTPLILNAEGRTVDSSGNVVELIQRMPTLKANIRVQKKEQFIKLKQEKQTEETSDHKFFDNRVGLKSALRPKRSFKFHEKGTFESLGQKLRTKVSYIYLTFI